MFPARKDIPNCHYGIIYIRSELKDQADGKESVDKLIRECVPELADNIHVVNYNKHIEFHHLTSAYPWIYGKVSLLGDSCFAIGPYAGIGVNLIKEHLVKFGDEVEKRGLSALKAISEELESEFKIEWEAAYTI